MLSKCLNPQCSLTFQYLKQGRLFRVDFTEASKKSALAGQPIDASIRSESYPLEHFWLCENCAATMTVRLSDTGVVHLAPIELSARRAITQPMPRTQTQQEAPNQLTIIPAADACV